jgi:hypothetical protein
MQESSKMLRLGGVLILAVPGSSLRPHTLGA